ncbi:MAG: hypothetical protein LBF72_03690 [Holosporales bacterium]|jgi:hypothetical protein|nr:hypothetical protein [Holosporales bacterium]
MDLFRNLQNQNFGKETRSTGKELRIRPARAEQLRAPGKVADFVGVPFDEPTNFRGLGMIHALNSFCDFGSSSRCP